MDKKSETIRQREKAQKDLLELKKIQRGEIDPSVLNDDDKKILPKTLDEKCENFLFYHKYKIIAIALTAVVLTIIITSTLSKPKYDAELAVYCYEFIDADTLADTADWVEKYYPDANDNGKVEILAIDCSFSSSDVPESAQTKQLKLQSLLVNKDAFLFILDEQTLEYLNSINENITLITKENTVELGEDFYSSLSDNRLSLKNDKKRFLCLRSIAENETDKKVKEKYESAKKALEKIKETV